MRWQSFSLVLTLLMLIAVTTFGNTLTMTAVPRLPWNGKVDITCEIQDTAPLVGEIQCSLQLKGYDQDQNQEIEIKTLSTDGITFNTCPGGVVEGLSGTEHHLVWDAAQDYPTLNTSAFVVSATITATSLSSTAPYLVVDLTTGESRKSSTGPDLEDDACRTTELWLRWIEPGAFSMGSPDGEVGRGDDEGQHQVTLTEGYWIGVFEVTQKQWELITGGNPSYHLGDTRPVEQVSYNDIRGSSAGAGWPDDGHAVDSDSFIGRLRSKTGLVFDLPSEAQWEYACRAGTTTALNSGKDLMDTETCSNLAEVGRYSGNVHDGKGDYTKHTKVGSYPPNAWGLYDMHGNVTEQCLDWYGDYETEAVLDPKGAEWGSDRVERGGAFSSVAMSCRSATRSTSQPSSIGEQHGLRVVVVRPAKYLVVDLTTGESRRSSTPPDLEDDTCRTTELWLRWIEPGTFTMGSPDGEKGRTSYETQHQVTLTQGFWMGVFEMTQKQWELIAEDYPAYYKGDTRPVEQITYAMIRGSMNNYNWPTNGHDVDSDSVLGKLRTLTWMEFDLPTEAQWEYACRAGTTTPLNSGKELTNATTCPNLAELGRYKGNQYDGKGLQHVTVGSYLPNAWGLYDMHGNVQEFCLDSFAPYGSDPVTDPMGGGASTKHVARGGDWEKDAGYCRVATRFTYSLWDQNAYLGVRLVAPAAMEASVPAIVFTADTTTQLLKTKFTATTGYGYTLYYNTIAADYEGKWTVYSKPIPVVKNGTFYFKAINSVGQEVASSITFTNIYERPDITLATNNETPTRQTTLAATTSSGLALYYAQAYTGPWKRYSAPIPVTENGIFYFKTAKDSVGQEGQAFIRFKNIDNTPPFLLLTGDTARTTTSSTLLAQSEANAVITYNTVSADYNGEWSSYSDVLTVTANATYFFRAVDQAGNVTAKSIAFHNIIQPLNASVKMTRKLAAAPVADTQAQESQTVHAQQGEEQTPQEQQPTPAVQEEGEEPGEEPAAVSPLATTPQIVTGETDNQPDLFVCKPKGVWSSAYQATHVGNLGEDWEGTQESISLRGKNKIVDIYTGSEDISILLLTNDANGDALFLDDIFSALPDEIDEPLARIAGIDEIYAGDGDDIVDMTSKAFAYLGEGMTIHGGNGNDTIWANKGSNVLCGDAGNDRLVGASGDDILDGGSGDDSLHGGGGSDIVRLCADWGHDTVEQLPDGKITLLFAPGVKGAWNPVNMTFTSEDGSSTVTVIGISQENIAITFEEE